MAIHGLPIEQTASLSISIFFALSPGVHKIYYFILNPLKTDDKSLIYGFSCLFMPHENTIQEQIAKFTVLGSHGDWNSITWGRNVKKWNKMVSFNKLNWSGAADQINLYENEDETILLNFARWNFEKKLQILDGMNIVEWGS